VATDWMATASPRSHPVKGKHPHKSVHELQDMSPSHAFSPPTYTHRK